MTLDEVRKLIQSNAVVIFGKGDKGEPRCGFTAQVQEIFDEIAPDYVMINVLDDKEGWREVLSELTDWPTFPQVFINGDFIGGCDIVCAMEEEGELEELFGH